MSTALKFVGLQLIFALLFGAIDSANAAEKSLGTKIKKIFEPTPTPAPRKHRKRLDEESDAQPIAYSFAKTQEDFTDSISEPDATKTQKEISDAAVPKRRHPRVQLKHQPFTLAASRRRKERRAERNSFSR